LKTYRATRDLSQKHQQGKYGEATQRNLVVAALVDSGTPQTIDSLVKKLDAPPYWATVKRKDRNGKPLESSWLIQNAKGNVTVVARIDSYSLSV
jgi:hypothetical protein